MNGYGTEEMVLISEIDEELRPASDMRVRLDQDCVERYAETIDTMEPIRLVLEIIDGRRHLWLSDGRHRIGGARHAGRDRIKAVVKPGTKKDAWIDAAGANCGPRPLALRKEDTSRGIERFLREFDIKKEGMTQAAVAKLFHASQQLVSQIYGRLYNSSNSERSCEKSDAKARKTRDSDERQGDHDGDHERTKEEIYAAKRQRVIDAYHANPSMTNRQLADAAKVSVGLIDKLRKELGLPRVEPEPEPVEAAPEPEANGEAAGDVPSRETINQAFPRSRMTAVEDRGDDQPETAANYEEAWERLEDHILFVFDQWPDEYKITFKRKLDSLARLIADKTPGWKPPITVEVDCA